MATPQSNKKSRRVQPVRPESELEEPFEPVNLSRPGLAAWLLLGPILSVVGVLGWLRICIEAPSLDGTPISWSALGLNFLLLLLFFLPHSLLARGFGRRFLNRPFGPDAERPVYVFISGVTLCVLVFSWKTTGPILWDYNDGLLILSRLIQTTGLLLATWAALVVGGTQLLGLPQLRALEKGQHAPSQEFVALPPYCWLRQPINAGFLLFLLGMPEVTADRLLLGIGTAIWILLCAPYEERDSEITFGTAYLDYKARTPRWIPKFGDRSES
ncbi:MAG: hypothetical protein QGH51_00275 [Planctomycetota bacterium]|nr:hypothetical protein [Planctomycetota bacterium]